MRGAMCFKWIGRKLRSYIIDRLMPEAERKIKAKVDEEIEKLKMEAGEQLNKMKDKVKNLENEVIEAIKKAFPEATAFVETAAHKFVEVAEDFEEGVGDLMNNAFGSNKQ